MFLIFSSPKKLREQKFENAPFSFGDETYGDNEQGTGILNTPKSFRDETYGDVKMSGLTYGVISYGSVTYGDVPYGDVSY